MIDQYEIEILRRVVVQACQKVGYSSAQTAPIALLQDILHWYLTEFTRDIRRHVEHYNRTEANSEDVAFSVKNMKLNIKELEDYIANVDPTPFTHDVAKFPISTVTNLNFLKPGSNEVLSRPVHVHDYLPPMSPPSALDTSIESKMEAANFQIKEECPPDGTSNTDLGSALNNNIETNAAVLGLIKNRANATSTLTNKMASDDFEAPSRQISSVFMTTGGFLSPAIEGKLPEATVPDIIEKYLDLDAPPPIPPLPPTPPPPSPTPAIVQEKKETLTEGQNLLKPLSFDKKKVPNVESKPEKGDLESYKKLNVSKENLVAKIEDNSSIAPNIQQRKQASLLVGNEPMQTAVPAKLLKKMKKKLGEGNVLDPNQLTKKKSHKLLKSLNNSEEFLANIPPGADTSKIMKLLKKQVRQRQKKLKEQGLLKGKNLNDNNPQAMALQPSSTQHPREIPNLMAPLMARQNALFGKALGPHQNLMQLGDESKKTPLELNPMLHMGLQTNVLDDKTDAPIEESKASPLLPGNTGGMEIKLSNEPDRSKLNIFKKISKQKASSLSPTLQSAPNAFLNAENEVISLPSGLTITPSPAMNAAAFNDGSINPKYNQLQGNLSLANTTDSQSIGLLQTPPTLLSASSHAASADGLVNKPKKRGRKPGSKNQPKVPPIGTSSQSLNMSGDLNMLQENSFRKPKKMKPNKMIPNSQDIFMRQQLQANLDTAKAILAESSNSSMPTQSTGQDDILQQSPLFSPHLLPSNINSLWPINLKSPHKERKDKEKSIMNDLNFSNQSANSLVSNPTSSKSEGSTDAGSFPSSALPFNVDGNNFLSLMKDMTQRKSKKRPAMQNVLGLPNFLNDGTQNPFSNLPGILPVYPQFPFPPRPGLIPTAGLFPPGSTLPCFPPATSNIRGSQGAQPPTRFMGLPPSFMPFSNMNTMLMKPSTQDELPNVLASNDRSYCNVAPLVPESMTLKSSKFDGKMSLNNQGVATGSSTAMSTSIAGTGKIHLGDAKANDPNVTGSGKKLNSSQLDAQNSKTDKLMIPAFGSNIPSFSKKMSLPTGGENDPIEVSDDSNDAPQSQMKQDSSFAQSMSLQESLQDAVNLKKPPLLSPAPFSSLAAPNLLKSDEISHKEMKKQKKVQRLEKVMSIANNNMTSAPLNLTGNMNVSDISQATAMSSLASTGCVSKLAGGADLIPLGNTGGLAYSSKSIPANSLTASMPQSKLNLMPPNAAPTSIFEGGITITPTIPQGSDVVMQKRKSKEHKKIKIKDGKIKKKKDKKAKLKNKEFLGDKAEMDRMTEKELMRKLKKSKKKQKQRLQAEGQMSGKHVDLTQAMNFEHAQGINLQPNVANISSIPPIPSIPEPMETSTVVPKLTLKLNTNASPTPPLLSENIEASTSSTTKHIPFPSSVKTDADIREPSPELARFSPLITRPPKPKFNASDAVSSLGVDSANADAIGRMDHKTSTSKTSVDTSAASTTHVMPPSPWQSGGTLSASSVLLPQQLIQSNVKTVEATSTKHSTPTVVPTPSQEKERPSSYIDDEGNRVWICPACGKIDDGSPMIGCDGCDAWYHWVCVGIVVAPKENEDWYCRVCITQKKGGVYGSGGEGKKRKRSKKNK